MASISNRELKVYLMHTPLLHPSAVSSISNRELKVSIRLRHGARRLLQGISNRELKETVDLPTVRVVAEGCISNRELKVVYTYVVVTGYAEVASQIEN